MFGGHSTYYKKYATLENQGSMELTKKIVGVSLVFSGSGSLFSAINLHKPHPLTKEVGLMVKSYS